MKTKLLYLTSFLLFLFTSCSLEENNIELSEQNKELKIKNLVKTFAEDIMPSESYTKFKEGLNTKSLSELTQQELDQLEQEFLSQQSSEFVELYNFVATLNLPKDELEIIVIKYFAALSVKSIHSFKSDSDDCEAAGDASGSTLFSLLTQIICEVIRELG